MITKILFTLVVIIGVSFYFRTKQPETAGKKPGKTKQAEVVEESVSTRSVAYIIIGVLVTISLVVFIFKYQSDNKIINIRVMSDSGVSTTYQARQKTIKGRSFETLEGTLVNLGESDRIEMIDQ